MKSSVKSLLSAALFGAVALVGHAQPALKILTVDVSKLYEGHWQTQEQNAKLEKENQEAGAQLQQLDREGRTVRAWPVPVQCPTMPCFGGEDLRTLFVTSARKGRPAEEIERMPASGQQLFTRTEAAGRPVDFFGD